MIVLMIAAVILYLMRPNSLTRRESGDMDKSSRDGVTKSLSKINVSKIIEIPFSSDHHMIHNHQWPTDDRREMNFIFPCDSLII